MTSVTRRGRRCVGTLGSLVVLLTSVACYEHTYTVGAGAPSGPVVYDVWRHHWLGGLIDPDQEVEINEMCPSGDATVHEEWTFLNGLVTALTGAIYSPTTVTVRCRRGGRAELRLSSEDVKRIASSDAFLERVGVALPNRADDVREALADLQ